MIEEKNINIQEDNQKYVITIHKSELKPSNLLVIWSWLKKIVTPQIGKKRQSKTWSYAGSISIGTNTDSLNLRDLAHE